MTHRATMIGINAIVFGLGALIITACSSSPAVDRHNVYDPEEQALYHLDLEACQSLAQNAEVEERDSVLKSCMGGRDYAFIE